MLQSSSPDQPTNSHRIRAVPGSRARIGFAGFVAMGLILGGCARRQSTLTARSETAERLSVEAREARERGDLSSAEMLLASAVERNPNDYDTRLELSEMLLADHKADAAAAHLQTLLDRNADDPRVFVGLAEARYQQRKFDEAENLVGQALDLDPRHGRGLLLRARIEHARGNTDGALDDLYQVLDAEEDNAEARLLIARLHLQQGDSRLAACVLRSLIDGPGIEPVPRAKAQWLLGCCYSRDGRWPEASTALAAGISGRRGTPRDWCLVADACRHAGDTQAAVQAVDNALRLSPGDHEATAMRAALLNHARSQTAPVIARASRFEDESEVPPENHPPDERSR